MIKKKNQKGLALSSSKGFTLLELLVVIGIIGLLASILVVNLTSARRKARDTKRVADVRQLQTAVEDYYGKNGYYPTLISALVTSGQISMWPTDPLAPVNTVCSANGDNCYFLASYGTVPANPQYYHLGTSLEDPGTTNVLLSQDRDCNSTVVGGACPSNTVYATGFNGGDAAGCSGTPSRYCYDIAQ